MAKRDKVIQRMADAYKGRPTKWEDATLCAVPAGCKPCRYCNGMCMEAEQIQKDWFGRGRVVRIYSMCDESDIAFENDGFFWKDALRTEFGTEEEAVAEWNKMNMQEDE